MQFKDKKKSMNTNFNKTRGKEENKRQDYFVSTSPHSSLENDPSSFCSPATSDLIAK